MWLNHPYCLQNTATLTGLGAPRQAGGQTLGLDWTRARPPGVFWGRPSSGSPTFHEVVRVVMVGWSISACLHQLISGVPFHSPEC